MDGMAHATMQATSRMAGHAHASGAMDSFGSGSTGADSSGTTFTYDNPYGSLALIPNTMTSSRNHMSGSSTNAAHATSAGENDFTAEGESHGDADIVNHAEADTASESEADPSPYSDVESIAPSALLLEGSGYSGCLLPRSLGG